MINNSTNINKTKESINSDGQQFHQYKQNKKPSLISNNIENKKGPRNLKLYFGSTISF